VADYLARFEIAEPDELPPFAGGAVGFFGYDLVRTVEPLGAANPDPVGLPDMALMITDVLVAFDHQRHEVTLIANAFVEDGGIEEAYERAVEAIGEVRERLREPVPGVEPSAQSTEVNFESNMRREQFESTVSRIIEYIHAGDAFQVVPSQRFTAPLRSRPSPSTAACARSIHRHTCTSSPSGTSRSRGLRPSP
jgi:anthranilate synthase component 1